MQTRKILIIDASDKPREMLRDLLEKECFEVFDFNNSMSAILWIKKNGAVAGIIIDEQATPLNASKTLDYMREELKMDLPALLITDQENGKNNQGRPGFITKPITENTIVKIKDFLNKPSGTGKNQQETALYSLQYLRDTYEGNEVLITESLTIFKNSVAIKIQEMQGLLIKKEFEEIRKVAHNIKPSFEMLGNKKATTLCRALAHDAAIEDMSQMVADLKNEFTRLKTELSKHFTYYLDDH